MRTVITRTINDGQVHDAPSTYDAAEAIAGHHLDRRKNYAIIWGDVCEVVQWSDSCSGCTESPEDLGRDFRGVGCRECGYTGRRRSAMFVPAVLAHRVQRRERAGRVGQTTATDRPPI